MESFEEKLFTGSFNSFDDLPPEQSHQVKVFLCANSTDFCIERDAIISRVVPKIREEAKAKYGLEFHYLDLKFGVEVTNEDDFKTREFMLDELLRCQKLSCGTSIVVLFGQKYGRKTIPHLMVSVIFDLIHQALLNSRGRRARHSNLLEKWYRRNENSIPSVYVLKQPLPSDSVALKKEWKEDKDNLLEVMTYGVELICKDGVLPPEALHTYFVSGFENEVKHGLMMGEKDRSLVYHRVISDISNYVSEYQVTSFTETQWNTIGERWELNDEGRQLLDTLLEQIVIPNIEEENIREYSVLWRYDSGIHPELHSDYLDELCDDVLEQLRYQLAEASAAHEARKVKRSALVNELLAHWRKAQTRGADCQGREKELDQIINYILSPNNRQFFTIYGDSGSGKTTLVSKLLLQMNEYVDNRVIKVIRYAGLTQESTNIRDLLNTICLQVLTALGRSEETPPNDYQELHKFFSSLISSIPSDRILVIIIDSVHNLLPDFNAHLLQWLPVELPANVKIVISSQTFAHDIVNRIKTEIVDSPHNLIDLAPLTEEKALMILLHWLNKEEVCITNEQVNVVKASLSTCTLPLYLRMVYEEVKTWHSFDVIEPTRLSSLNPYLTKFFENLEAKHGRVIVKHAIAYLTASKTGLSDTEMEDLLSLDDSVLNVVYSDTIPAVRRCPPFIWANLRNDLNRFLLLKVCDGVDVYDWDHQFLTHFTERRYLNDGEFQKEIHHMIADYYLGTWHGRSKSYIDIFGKPAAANRYVLSQPLTYVNAIGQIEYNKRKYDQVPRHLYLANRLDELNSKVLFNYKWIFNKIKVLSLQHILTDLALNPGKEASLLEGALRAAQPTLKNNMNNMPAELSGRLLPYYPSCPNLRRLIDECDRLGLEQCALVPIFSYHDIPGSPLLHTLRYSQAIDNLYLIHNGRTAVVKSKDSQTIGLYDVHSGDCKGEVFTSYGSLYLSQDERYFVVVDNEVEKAIKIHNVHDGSYCGQIIPLHFIDAISFRKYKMGTLSVSSNYIATLVTTDKTYLCVARINDTDNVMATSLEGKANLVQIAPNENYVLCNVGVNVKAFDLRTLEEICLTQLEYRPTVMAMTNDSSRCYYTDDRSHIITCCQMTSEGYTQMVCKISLVRQFLGESIRRIKLSNDEIMLLVQGENTIVVFNTQTDKTVLRAQKPPTVMKEFKLPKQAEPTPISYTDAQFSLDDKYLLVSLFRDIQFWDLRSGQPLSKTLLAPMGIVTKIMIAPATNSVLSLQQGSRTVQVWDPHLETLETTSLDRLSGVVDRIVVTEDNLTAFATSKRSDEVAVIDMGNGTLSNLLTHECSVEELLPVKDGSYLFVTVNPSQTEFCHKIWSVKERKVIKEFGKRQKGLTAVLRKSNTLIHVSQVSNVYQSPYNLTIYRCNNGEIEETTYDFMINHAVSQPFVTADDTYMVLLTADEYIEKQGIYRNPAICAFYLKGRYMHSIIGNTELSPFLDQRHIIALLPISQSQTDIIALYKTKLLNGLKHGPSKAHSNMLGYACISLPTSSIKRYSDNFMPGETNLNSLYFNNDGTQCLNTDLGLVFDMTTGEQIATINNKKSPIALLYDGKAVAYFKGSDVIVERLPNNEVVARCDLHTKACFITPGRDERTVLIGTEDGTILSYMLIDSDLSDQEFVLKQLPSRQILTKNSSTEQVAGDSNGVNNECYENGVKSLPLKPRAKSAMTLSNVNMSDRDILKKIRPVHRSYGSANHGHSANGRYTPQSASSLYSSYSRSKTCSIM